MPKVKNVEKKIWDVEGFEIRFMMNGKDVKVTRLARGLPMGGNLEYIDEATIMRAMEGRTSL